MGEYIVTARKWRPMRFEDVVGQEHVTTTLRNALESQRLAHAYIFSGPRGVGKTTTARLLAKAVNCLHPDHTNPDNTCELCVEVNEGRSFDVLEIDGASNRGVEEIRNLRESVRYAPARGSKKVYIIDEVHMLTKEAFNALLKTLEEPPPHVLFIFATTELHKLPATILSRCQRFDFRRIPTDRIKDNLAAIAAAEGLSLDDEALTVIARKGDGSLRDAQSTFDMVISLCGTAVTHEQILQALNVVDQELYFRATDYIRQRETAGALALVEEVVGRGYDLKEFVGGLVEHLRNLLVAKATGSTQHIEAADIFKKRYSEEAQKFSIPDLLRYQRLASGTEASFRWVAQPRFRLEADMMLLTSMPDAADVGTVLREIEELKKKAADSTPVTSLRHPSTDQPSTGPAIPVDMPRKSFVRPGGEPAQPEKQPFAAPPAINDGEVKSRWKEFTDLVRQRHVMLGTSVDRTAPHRIEGTILRVACPDAFHAEALSRNREKLSDLFQEMFHVRVRLEPVIEKHPDNEQTAESEHPIVTVIKREFGAELL